MSEWFYILECPRCKQSYSKSKNQLICYCGENIPFQDDIVYYSDKGKEHPKTAKNQHYEEFLKFKIHRPAIDLYAAFQPFNESTRAIYPFIDLIKQYVKPGDWILDTWCRTGWTSNWLASLFHEQQILSVWEGNRDVLGYDGFNYWFHKDRKLPNQHFIFLDLSEPLPFADNVFSFINGLETLHRYNQSNVIHEIQRVTQPEGIILYPHNHLTNNEPDPYFDRGEIQRHGTVYDRYFNNYLRNKQRTHFILSEIELFEQSKTQQLVNNPNMTDYNALIGLLPDKYAKSELKPYQVDYSQPARLYSLVNPFLKIDTTTCKVSIDLEFMNGSVGKILERHPIYEKRIETLHKTYLEIVDIQIIYWSRLSKNLEEIASVIGISEADLIERIKLLNYKDILQTHLLNRNGARMYYFQSNQNFFLEEENRTVNYLFDNLSWKDDDTYLILDGELSSALTYEEVRGLVESIRKKLIVDGLMIGDTIGIQATLHFEAVLLFWAATMNGLNVEIFNSELSQQIVSSLASKSNPKIFFTTKDSVEINCQIIQFDDEEDKLTNKPFSDWLSEVDVDEISLNNEVSSNQKAVTLYTSGSTGLPNAITLTHGMLVNSAKQIVDTFKWSKEDTFIATSEIDSMSGLRNTCLATLYSGCRVVIPEIKGESGLFKIIHSIASNKATIISSTPAVLKQFVKMGEAVKTQINSLDKILSTASVLTQNLIDDFYRLFNKKILNYYGLTETSGICISSIPSTDIKDLQYLGKPVTGVVQLVSEQGKVIKEVNQPGEIRVYGENVISSYSYDQEAGYKFKDGWIYTGDIAMILENGYFQFLERKRNILKNNFGETIYLKDIRSKIMDFSEIDDVYISTIVEDDLETMVALIKSNSHNKIVQEAIRNRLNYHERPKRLIFIDKIPYNSRGKVDNDVINQLALAHEI